MKKNKMMRIASVLLVAVLLSTCAISGTFAKYTSTFEGTSTAAKVATWNVTVNGAAETADFEFDILETVLDTKTGAEDADVNGKLLAPGTKGSFKIVINNQSDVTATYTVGNLTPNTALPFEFVVDTATATIAAGASATVTVDWVWPFEVDGDAAAIAAADAIDKALQGQTITVTTTVTVEQVD